MTSKCCQIFTNSGIYLPLKYNNNHMSVTNKQWLNIEIHGLILWLYCLSLNKLPKHSIGQSHQSVITPNLSHSPMVQNSYLVSMFYGGQSMGNGYDCSTNSHSLQSLLDKEFTLSIECTASERVIEVVISAGIIHGDMNGISFHQPSSFIKQQNGWILCEKIKKKENYKLCIQNSGRESLWL